MNSQATTQAVKICRGCSNIVDTDYCSKCGEYQHHQRFSLKKVISDIPNAVMNFERGLLYTIKSLAVKPGGTIDEYLEGVRSRHYRPLNFVFLVGGLYTLLFSLVQIQGVSNYEYYKSDWERFLDEQTLQYQAFLLLFQLPFISLITWLLFRKNKLFYGEHLVGNAYMVGEITLYQLIFFPLYAIFNHTSMVDVLNTIYLIFMAGFGFFTYYDWFYQRKGTAMQILLGIAAVIANIAVVAITSYPLMIIIYQVKTAIFGE